MAEITITKRVVSDYGRFRREFGSFTQNTGADFQIRTKVGAIIFFSVTCADAATARACKVAYNSNTTSDDVPGLAGLINMDADGSPALTNGKVYSYEVIGRG